MKTAESTERATGSATPATLNDNPYLQQVANEDETDRTQSANGSLDTDDEATLSSADLAVEEKERKQRRRRRFVLAFIATLLLASVVIAAAIYRQRSTRVEYGRAGNQPRVLPPPPNASAPTGRDNRTDQAIQEMHQLTTGESRSAGNARVQATTREETANSANRSLTNSPIDSSHPFDLPNSSDAPNPTTSDKTTSTGSVTANEQQPVRSQRNAETSLYVAERIEERLQPASRNPELPLRNPAVKETSTQAQVALPPFGSMLPVRTVGGLYTLRNGALVRLELTRDMVANGWSMTRGTTFVGTTKGGEYDRAYVAIIGFIDPRSGRFVKLGGDVLGGDGASGLNGKLRQVDGRWTRVLSQLGNAAITVTSAALGGRGNGTVVISDGARSPLINPVSDELNGMIGSQLDRNRRTGFVEVVAGTPGYVMVTDLPAAIKGTDSNAELNLQTLSNLSNIDAPRPTTGISEREFAELIANASPEEIKAKVHKMSPEMRKIALAILEP